MYAYERITLKNWKEVSPYFLCPAVVCTEDCTNCFVCEAYQRLGAIEDVIEQFFVPIVNDVVSEEKDEQDVTDK